MIKDKLKEIRENIGMNKKEFANCIGIKYTTYNGYETGAREPDSDFLILIAQKFDVSTDYILGLRDEKDITNSYQLKSSEYKHIEKYRDLDDHGKNIVTTILNIEYDRIKNTPAEPRNDSMIPKNEIDLMEGTMAGKNHKNVFSANLHLSSSTVYYCILSRY